MYRKAEQKLAAWKARSKKKALLVTGHRQVGKTYIIHEFGKANYRHYVEINFIKQPSAAGIFAGDLDIDTLIMKLTAFTGEALTKGQTLIFLDEIQECPNARTAIKFLVEAGGFDYIESGSLLGVQYKQVPSYPVGYEEIVQMYPMDFEEFCIANGVQQSTLTYLRECFEKQEPITASVHQTMLNLFKYYIVVGGMPEVVQKFVDTHDIGQVIELQRGIVAQLRQDISKYSKYGKNMIGNIFDNIPSQLEDKNRRFMLSSIQKNARLRDYEDSFIWLKDAGVALPCYNLAEPKIPLKINEQRRLFKLYMSDVGLLCSMSLENTQFEILRGNLTINLEGIVENCFAELLKANGFNLRYLNKKQIGELDFVVQQNSEAIPIEIKSGKNYKSHAAIDNALNIRDWKLNQGIVFCRDNIQKAEKVTYLPWYLVMFFKPSELDQSAVVDVDLSGLQ